MKFFALMLLAVAVAHAQNSDEFSVEDPTYETESSNGDPCICTPQKEITAVVPEECVQYVDARKVEDNSMDVTKKSAFPGVGLFLRSLVTNKKVLPYKGAAKKGFYSSRTYNSHSRF